jgi:predicted phage-related endonuclease
MNLVNDIDLDLLLEDQARLTKRVAELEDNQETILKFLNQNFHRKSERIKRILQRREESRKPVKPQNNSAFGQEDTGMTTEEAVRRCFVSKNVSSDPILLKVGISGTENKARIPASLRG